MLVNSPQNFPLPNQYLSTHRSFLHLLAGSANCWAAPTSLQTLYLPILWLKKEPRVSDRDISSFMNGETHMPGARSCSRQAGHGNRLLLKGGGGGRVLFIRGIDIWLGHWLPGKPAKGHASHRPFNKLSWQLKLNQSLARVWGKYVGRSVRRIACKWSRHWSGRGTATLNSLIIQQGRGRIVSVVPSWWVRKMVQVVWEHNLSVPQKVNHRITT